MKYEYKVRAYDIAVLWQRVETEEKMNEMGELGFKLIATEYTETTKMMKCVFMREKLNEERTEPQERRLEPEL